MGPMLLRGIALLFIASTCLAQTVDSAATSSPPDDTTVLTTQAKQGKSDAQLKLGNAYLHGQGVAQDNVEAIRWFRAAGENGNAEAQYILGLLYAEGKALGQDKAEAFKWCMKAAEQGRPEAQTLVGVMFRNGDGTAIDHAKAMMWFGKAADQKFSAAELNLGIIYDHGLGVEVNFAKAAEYYRLAIEHGSALASSYLGSLYDFGRGVPRDHQHAIELYTQAAEKGVLSAQNYLAFAYFGGQGVRQDFVQSAKWTQLAAAQGDMGAENRLGELYLRGQGVARSHRDAFLWYSKAAEQGSASAMAQLGSMVYEGGDGMKRDYVQSYKWFLLARRGGYYEQGFRCWITEKYCSTLQELEDTLSPKQIAEGKSSADEWTTAHEGHFVHRLVKVDRAVLSRYVGTYEITRTYSITISVYSDHLETQGTKQPRLPIFAESQTKFFDPFAEATVEFFFDDKGQVSYLILSHGAQETKGVRKWQCVLHPTFDVDERRGRTSESPRRIRSKVLSPEKSPSPRQ